MKKRIAAAGIAVFLAAAAAAFYFADTAAVFKGTRTAEPDRFELTFTEMNKTDSDDMPLEEGDVLSVGFHIAKGKADLEIGLKGKEPVYRGNGYLPRCGKGASRGGGDIGHPHGKGNRRSVTEKPRLH